MTCWEIQEHMDGYLDHELDPVRSFDIQRHLDRCLDCSRLHRNRMEMRAALRDDALRYRAPDSLRQAVAAAIANDTAAPPRPAIAQQASAQPSARRGRRWIWTTASIAAAAAFAVLVWIRPSENPVEHDVFQSHLRSLMADHLTDVVSTDQHTVKPWFAGKLDFSPPVKTLDAQGFILAGGRLDYIGGRPVAALVYRRRLHVINVFIWPSGSSGDLEKESSRQGYNIIRRIHGGTEYWLISDVEPGDLRDLAAQLVQ